MKNFYNIILTSLFIAFWGFLAYRTISEKIPRNLLIFTGIFVIFFILRISGKYLIFAILNTYKKIKNLSSDDQGKISIFVKKNTEKLDNFIEKEFKSNFLYRYGFISSLSLKCLKIYEKNLDNFYKIFFAFYVLPWILSIFCYLFEIFYSGDLYFSLYIFPLSLLIRRIFYDIILTTIVYESKRILETSYEWHFPIFFSRYATLREFFLVNQMPRYEFLYHQEKFQNKEDIIFFWNLFNELYFSNIIYRSILNWHKPLGWHFKKFAFKINGTLFATTFFVILFAKIFFNQPFLELFIVLLIFLGCFTLFFFSLQFLNGFELDENNNDYTSYFGSAEKFRDFYSDSLVQEKKDLTDCYDFLKTSDLKFTPGYPSLQKLHSLRNSPSSSKMSLENFEQCLAIQKKIADWYYKAFMKGEIHMATFSYVKKK